MAYLYRHIRLDNNVPFYIGIGRDKHFTRAKNSKERSRFWFFVTNKTGYEVEIMIDGISIEEAMVKEVEFIALYGRADLKKGTLVNMTDGGDGCNGRKVSPEQVKNMIEWCRTPEARAKKSKNMKGNQRTLGYRHSDDAKNKISESNKGLKRTPEQNEANSKRNKGNKFFLGKKHTEETKDKMRQLHLEGKIGRSGPHSQESKDKISKALMGRSKSEETKNSLREANINRQKPVRQLSIDGVLIKEWDSISAVVRGLGVCKGDIIKVCKGYVRSDGYQRKTVNGYKWEYIN